jgi:GMP synthase-like glutamine amidotransferase
MVFGGSQHPDQDEHFAWLGQEESFLREVLAEKVPVLGVCLGAQMLARAADAKVGPANAPEVGWLDVELTPAGAADPVLGVLPHRASVFQWHHYTFEVPEGGVELARSDVCPQAFRLSQPAWGIQFHAEVTLPMLTAWSSEDPADLPMPLPEFLDVSRARIDQSTEQGRALCAAFLNEAAHGLAHGVTSPIGPGTRGAPR